MAIALAALLLFPLFDRRTNREPGLIQQRIDAIEKHQKAYAFAQIFPLADEHPLLPPCPACWVAFGFSYYDEHKAAVSPSQQGLYRDVTSMIAQ